MRDCDEDVLRETTTKMSDYVDRSLGADGGKLSTKESRGGEIARQQERSQGRDKRDVRKTEEDERRLRIRMKGG